MAKKSNKTTGESSINDASQLLSEMSDIEAKAIADQYRQTVVSKALELIVGGNSAGPKTNAIVSQFKAGLYEAIASSNQEAIEATVSEEELNNLRERALSPTRLSNPNLEGGDDEELRLLGGGF